MNIELDFRFNIVFYFILYLFIYFLILFYSSRRHSTCLLKITTINKFMENCSSNKWRLVNMNAHCVCAHIPKYLFVLDFFFVSTLFFFIISNSIACWSYCRFWPTDYIFIYIENWIEAMSILSFVFVKSFGSNEVNIFHWVVSGEKKIETLFVKRLAAMPSFYSIAMKTLVYFGSGILRDSFLYR